MVFSATIFSVPWHHVLLASVSLFFYSLLGQQGFHIDIFLKVEASVPFTFEQSRDSSWITLSQFSLHTAFLLTAKYGYGTIRQVMKTHH